MSYSGGMMKREPYWRVKSGRSLVRKRKWEARKTELDITFDTKYDNLFPNVSLSI